MSDSITLNQIVWDLLKKRNGTLEKVHPRAQKVLHSLSLCGKDYYGFTSSRCEDCGHTEIHYGTCRNPNCPSCGGAKRKKWIEKQKSRAIRACAFHIIFTVPDRYLNELALHDPRFFYNALFDASSRALRKLCADPQYFGARRPGYFSCLHTWGSALVFHPHIHTVLYGSGLDEKGNLVQYRRNKTWLFPAKLLAARFKKEMIRILSRKYEKTNSPWLQDLSDAKRTQWNVQIQKGADYPDQVIQYLGRYVSRTAISNSRIHGYDGEHVTFEYKDYRDHRSSRKNDRCAYVKKEMTLSAEEFVRRFALHIPPRGYRRTRFYGFLAPNQNETLEKMKTLTGTCPEAISESSIEETGEDEEYNQPVCPKCHGKMTVILRRLRQSIKDCSPEMYLMLQIMTERGIQKESVKD